MRIEKENMIAPDPELYVLVGVRDKKTKKEGLTFLYNEIEVDRRLEILDKALPPESEHRDVYNDLVEFHRVRREAFEKIKDNIEIVLLGGR